MAKSINIPGSAKDAHLQDRFNQDVAQRLQELATSIGGAVNSSTISALQEQIDTLKSRLTAGGL